VDTSWISQAILIVFALMSMPHGLMVKMYNYFSATSYAVTRDLSFNAASTDKLRV